MPEPTTEPTDATAEQGKPADEALGDAGKQALDRMKVERNEAKQAAASLQAKLDEINKANETALEKAQREAAELREQVQMSALEAIRFRIAAETGITDNVDLILTAPDEDTMRRQAQLWVDRPTTTSAGPKPDLTQGGSGHPLALNSDGLEDALRSKLGI